MLKPDAGNRRKDSQASRRAQWRDGLERYGWVSILLHWLAAILVLALWFLGDTIGFTAEVGARLARIERHVSLALAVYILLVARVGWRLRSGYPRVNEAQPLDRLFSRIIHAVMLASIVVMLLSGPVLAISTERPLEVLWGIQLPFLVDVGPSLRYSTYVVHSTAGSVLLFAVFLHICGACKHLMFDDDDVFIRMLLPGLDDGQEK
jgi:cytochrome b561